MRFAELLTPQEVRRTHEASLEVLETVGIARPPPAGARGLQEARLQRRRRDRHREVPGRRRGEATVPWRRRASPSAAATRSSTAPSPTTVRSSSPARSAPNVVDPVTGVERRATSADIANIAHLINELPGFDVFSHLDPGRRRARGPVQPEPLLPGAEELPQAGAQQHAQHGRPAPGASSSASSSPAARRPTRAADHQPPLLPDGQPADHGRRLHRGRHVAHRAGPAGVHHRRAQRRPHLADDA